MRHLVTTFSMALLALAALSEVASAEEGVAPQENATQSIDGMWQLTDVIDGDGGATSEAGQMGRLLQLGRQSLVALDGTSCANPTLSPLSDLRMRGIDPLLLRLEKVEGAYKQGIAALCLGSLFAVYVPQADGSLIAADRVALYHLQPLATPTTGTTAQ